jgi:hypothetical protein
MAAGAAAYQRGELTRTGLALIDLARLRAVRARHGAFQRAALDGATLEAALGLWVIDPPPHWPDPTQDPRSQEPEH